MPPGAVAVSPDFAADDQLVILYLNVELVPVASGQLGVDAVGVVGLAEVGHRRPRHVCGLEHGEVTDSKVHQLAHPVVDVLELPGRVEDGKTLPASADR